MSGKLAQEIRQTKPFTLREEEAFLNLGRTWEHLHSRIAELLKQFGLTSTQYNMLRILRGAGEEGLTCSQATERMISPDPDVTRLLDRMEARKLIRRERSTSDRRIVVTRITPEGLALVGKIDMPMRSALREMFASLGEKKLESLIGTLEVLREPEP